MLNSAADLDSKPQIAAFNSETKTWTFGVISAKEHNNSYVVVRNGSTQHFSINPSDTWNIAILDAPLDPRMTTSTRVDLITQLQAEFGEQMQ